MVQESISNKQAIVMMIMLILGTSTIVTTGLVAKHNLWLAVLIALLFSLVLNLGYARLHTLKPNQNFYGILEETYGQFLGKIISLSYILFAIYLGALVLNNILTFIITTSLYNTPQVVIGMIVVLLASWLVKEGIEVIGRWSSFTLPIMFFFIFFLVLFLLPQMDLSNLEPIAHGNMKEILSGALSSFTFPFGDIVIFLLIFSVGVNKISIYRVYLLGTLIGGGLILLISINNLVVLGFDLTSSLHFSTYSAAAKLNIGDFLQRLEILVAAIFILGAFLKFSLSLLAACKGISSLFNYKDYRFIVLPVGLIILNLSQMKLVLNTILSEGEWNRTVWDSFSELLTWSGTRWPYFAFVITVIIPLVTLIIAELQYRLKFKHK
ncbi:MAG: GerAB/ArcD/ProY family transporter [Bacillota bacterium]